MAQDLYMLCLSYHLPFKQFRDSTFFDMEHQLAITGATGAGCNFLRCRCSEGYCFICGEGSLEDDSNHWSLGKPCPKYNQPDAHNAMYAYREDEEA